MNIAAKDLKKEDLIASGLLLGLYLRKSHSSSSSSAQSASATESLWEKMTSQNQVSGSAMFQTLVHSLAEDEVHRKNINTPLALTSFLSTHFLHNEALSEAKRMQILSEADHVVIDQVIDHFCVVKDMDNVSTLLFFCLKHVSHTVID